tara:strand:- start:11225 stop:12058 length:834 start_codon:yes stop_codon:yes gene_type:complete
MAFIDEDGEYPINYGVANYPVLAKNTSGLIKRVESLLTPEKLKSRFLKGLDLSDYSNDELKDRINLAIAEAELLIDVPITPVQRKEKHPFDRNLYQQFVHVMTNFGPISSVEKFGITSSNDVDIFPIPADWIESARFFQKQVNVIPLTVVGATGITTGSPTGAAGLAFIAAMNGGISWVPSYWEIEYTTGVCTTGGQVPLIVNELIGAIAAIDILGNLGPQNLNTSVSVSHDGISQSSSNPGPAAYQTRIGELAGKKDDYVKKIRRIYYNKYYMSNI